MYVSQMELKESICFKSALELQCTLRENILTDGTIQEFQEWPLQISNREQKSLFFFSPVGWQTVSTESWIWLDIWVNIPALAPSTKESWPRLVKSFFFFRSPSGTYRKTDSTSTNSMGGSVFLIVCLMVVQQRNLKRSLQQNSSPITESLLGTLSYISSPLGKYTLICLFLGILMRLQTGISAALNVLYKHKV